MAYDSAIISFTTKTDKVDLVQAAHVNSVQSELVTIETILGTTVKGDRADLKTRLANALDADGSMLSGTAFPSPSFTSQFFFRTDVNTAYIRDTTGTFNALGGSLSNVLFSFSGQTDNTGYVVGTSLTPAANSNYAFWQVRGADVYTTAIATKWTKISGISTWTIYARIWGSTAGKAVNILVDVGGVNGNVSGTVGQVTPEWVTFTINVSSLTNGSTYDVVVQLKNITDNSDIGKYLGSIIAFGS